ncbi:TPA: hypothetical protein ACTYH4_001335 [Klebsiella variicola]
MTVSTEVDHNDYTGNGVTTSFPYTFRIFKKSDLTVQVADLNENITVLTLDTDYSVTGAGTYSGGNVVLMSPLANGWQISISRDLPVTQETDLRNQGKFFAEVHEDAFDKLTMLIQQCFSFLRLALRKPSFIADYYDALNNRIRNLRDPSQAQDAATKNYADILYDEAVAHADNNLNKTLRVPENSVTALPVINIRKNKILAFNNQGNPIPVLPESGSAADVLIELGSNQNGKGISLTALEQGGDGQDLAVFVSPKMVHTNSYSHFGAAMMAAFTTAMAMGIGEVRVPAGTYILDSTVAVTLSMSMSLVFDPGVIIYVDSPLTAFNFDVNGKHLAIEGNNARILSSWGSQASTGTVAFKFSDATLDKSLTVSNLKVGTADSTSKFQYSIYGSGLNLTTFTNCVLQSTYGVYLESVLLNGTSYHAMGILIDECKIYTDDYCIKIGNQGALGCEGFIVNGGELVCDTTAIIIDNIGLTSSAYLPPLFRIESVHISAYRALYAKDISRLFFSGDVQIKSNPSITGTYNGVIELGGVQQFHHGRVSYSSVPLNGATGADMIPIIYQFASTLSNAFFTSNGNIYQLDAMTAPVFAFSGTANITEIQVSNDRLNSSGTWVDSAWLAYVRLSPEMTIGNLGAAGGLDYSTKGAFSAGVLSLGTRPSQGFTYSIPVSIVPNSSGISQITFPSQMVGKEVNILLAAANVSFTHGTNMVCPDQKSFVMTLPNVIKVFALNTTQCIILDVGGMANRHTDITSIPTSRTSPGYPGAEVFDSANMILYRYISGYGWGKVTITAIS